MNSIFDTIIVGAGFAGLYYAFKHKPSSFLILERDERIGGRVYNRDWNDNQISLGGGVLKDDDVYTINLAKSFGLKISDGVSKYHFIDFGNKKIPNENTFYKENKSIIENLKKIYSENKDEIETLKLTFDQFLLKYLKFDDYNNIVNNLLYKTFLNADPKTVLDTEIQELLRTDDFKLKFINNGGYTVLLEKLIEEVGLRNIKIGVNVQSIKKTKDIFYITTNFRSFKCKNVVIATALNNKIRWGLDYETNTKLRKLYSLVGGSKYIRIYSYHSGGHKLTSSYRTSGLPGKIIVINDKILMCCYTEDNDAVRLKKILDKKNKSEQIDLIYDILKNCNVPVSKPDDIIHKFWTIGVHYYKPNYSEKYKNDLIKELKDNNIMMIGEAYAPTHGWVNCALESVELLDKLN
jgi:hypothetical protein